MNRYEAPFKKKHSGRLIWISCLSDNETIATEKLKGRMRGTKYILYGGPFLTK
jgi:hypothetical protein